VIWPSVNPSIVNRWKTNPRNLTSEGASDRKLGPIKACIKLTNIYSNQLNPHMQRHYNRKLNLIDDYNN